MSRDRTKTYLVTGSASGIGKQLSQRLLADGHQVICSDIDLETLGNWADGIDGAAAKRALIMGLDVRQAADWEAAFDAGEERFGAVDGVLNIAGYLQPGYVMDLSDEDVERHLDINIKGVILGTRAAAKRMKSRGQGHIVNMGSLASLTAVPGLSLYGASKFAVRGFSLSVAEELRPFGVDVSLVLLDAVRTPMLDRQADYEEAALTFSGRRPLTLAEVERLMMDEVLARRPLEVAWPRSRGLMARVAGAAPAVLRLLGPLMRRMGQKAQEAYRDDE